MQALEKQDPNDQQQDSNDEKIKFATGLARNRFANIDIFCAFDSFRRKFKCPRQQSLRRKLSLSTAALRTSEIRSTPLAATTTRQSRRRTRLCKHCAALARRKSSLDSRQIT